MNAKHTPGPWVHNSITGRLTGANRRFICNLEGQDLNNSSECRANARLIAASSELLKSLEALVKLHHDWDKGSAYLTVAFYEKNKAAIAEARAAIAKATGE